MPDLNAALAANRAAVRVLRKGTFPKGKTNQAMNPARGPATPAEARVRLEGAVTKCGSWSCTRGTIASARPVSERPGQSSLGSVWPTRPW